MSQKYSGETFNDNRSWARRNGFADWVMAVAWILVAFILFLLASNLIALVLVLMRAPDSAGTAEIINMLMQEPGLFFIGNTIGQILFLGGATWFACRLQVSKEKRPLFLRFTTHKNTAACVGMAMLLVITIQPAILYLGWLNSFLPVPETFEQMQAQSMEMIKAYINGDSLLWLALFHISVVPAVCEEVLFRGYALRSFEKSWGPAAAIIVSGIIFGVYHLQPGNILALATLGILFGYITWASQSILPAMGAHFLNNAASVLLGRYYPNLAFAELSPDTLPSPWLIGVSVVISGYLVYLLYRNRAQPSIK